MEKCECGRLLKNIPGEIIKYGDMEYEVQYPPVTYVQYKYGKLVHAWCSHGKTIKRPMTIDDWLDIFKGENATLKRPHILARGVDEIRCAVCGYTAELNKKEQSEHVFFPWSGDGLLKKTIDYNGYGKYYIQCISDEIMVPMHECEGRDPVKVGCDENYECRWDCMLMPG